MSDLGWRADGIAKARAVGGIDLETYRRPGFGAGTGVRRVTDSGGPGSGFEVYFDPDYDEDPEPEDFRK